MAINSIGAVLAIIAILVGVLMALSVIPLTGVTVGLAVIILGVARLT